MVINSIYYIACGLLFLFALDHTVTGEKKVVDETIILIGVTLKLYHFFLPQAMAFQHNTNKNCYRSMILQSFFKK